MKGIILAGGYGTRLYPITKSISKHLLPVYDKPLIYYPLSVLMLPGIRDILIISTPRDISHYKGLLGDGRQIGMSFTYAVQEKRAALRKHLLLVKNSSERIAWPLSSVIISSMGSTLRIIKKTPGTLQKGAVIFGYYVKDPRAYRVVQFMQNKKLSRSRKNQ